MRLHYGLKRFGEHSVKSCQCGCQPSGQLQVEFESSLILILNAVCHMTGALF